MRPAVLVKWQQLHESPLRKDIAPVGFLAPNKMSGNNFLDGLYQDMVLCIVQRVLNNRLDQPCCFSLVSIGGEAPVRS